MNKEKRAAVRIEKPLVQFPELIDAQDMCWKYPRKLWTPSREELEQIKIGSFCRVCCADERFWVLVLGKGVIREFLGVIDNVLLHPERHGLAHGDMIEFDPCHVYNIEQPTWH